jgi:hypothetical protein
LLVLLSLRREKSSKAHGFRFGWIKSILKQWQTLSLYLTIIFFVNIWLLKQENNQLFALKIKTAFVFAVDQQAF